MVEGAGRRGRGRAGAGGGVRCSCYCYWWLLVELGFRLWREYRVVHCPDNGWYWCVSRSQRARWSTGYNTQQPHEATPRTKSFIDRFRVRWKEVVPMSAPSDKDRMRLERLKAYSNLIRAIGVLAKTIGEWFF